MTEEPRAAPVDHYENFPVASWLCPPRLRPPIAAIYWFARTADDIADEGDAPAGRRIEALAAYRADLVALSHGRATSGRWDAVFRPLGAALREFALPAPLLLDLLSAFEQDIVKTRDGHGYRDRGELLDYCARSANPVGRLLLHLYGIADEGSLARSDAICSALQLINFWQDLGVDLPRGRRYLPDADCAAFHVDPLVPASAPVEQRRALVRHECEWARELMLEGAPLARRVPGRAGWELRGVVQGGLRILDRIEALGFDTFTARPTIRRRDVAVIGLRMLRM
ncbi:squalene synthase HpnC [Ramlibacter humi]|uniref:Squalene synthase HpnC n=1 Tax=Ramlibacter humi TaxID=2530451 RepID=A0A4Z0CCN6_9BURK|nr:squalene synthase HpnC [Ramlibacter humi]TFZ08692.1 squalene synthase HpnC [Ramlibacter humi]